MKKRLKKLKKRRMQKKPPDNGRPAGLKPRRRLLQRLNPKDT